MNGRLLKSSTLGIIGSTILVGCGMPVHVNAAPAGHPGAKPAHRLAPTKISRPTSSLAPSRTTSPSSPSSSPDSPSPFPKIIQQAMHKLSSKTAVPLWAPTTYPGAVHTPLPVTALGYVNQHGYQVVFQRNQLPIGHYSVNRWASNHQAELHLFSAMTAPPLPAMTTTHAPALSLGNNIVGHLVPMPTGHSHAIVWQEGRWTMVTEYPPGQQAKAQAVAVSTVSYAHTHFLPPPKLKGWLVEQVGPTVYTTMVWEQYHLAFETAAFGPWNSNLSGGWLAALEMAATIHLYS